jgi:hypothetical protein
VRFGWHVVTKEPSAAGAGRAHPPWEDRANLPDIAPVALALCVLEDAEREPCGRQGLQVVLRDQRILARDEVHARPIRRGVEFEAKRLAFLAGANEIHAPYLFTSAVEHVERARGNPAA